MDDKVESKEQVLMSFFQMTLLNEVFMGLTKDYYESRLKIVDTQLNINFAHAYLLLTGLKKDVFTGVYGLSTDDYVHKVFKPGYIKVEQLMFQNGYQFEMHLVTYTQTKQFAVLFSPSNNSKIDACEIAWQVQKIIQEQYESVFLGSNDAYCNFSVLSPVLHSYEEIHPAFLMLSELSNASFFMLEPTVMTQEQIMTRKVTLKREELYELLQLLCNAVIAGDVDTVKSITKDIFLVKLKLSFDRDLCESALSKLRRQTDRYAIAFDIKSMGEFDAVFKFDSYASVEQMYAAIEALLIHCTNVVKKSGWGLNSITLDALQYMNLHYHNSGLSLEEIASYVGVVPEYLSRKFKKDTSKTLIFYLTNLRIEQAKQMLSTGNMKVNEVADAVGLNPKYFSRVFKKHTNLAPHDYKKVQTETQ